MKFIRIGDNYINLESIAQVRMIKSSNAKDFECLMSFTNGNIATLSQEETAQLLVYLDCIPIKVSVEHE